MLEKLLLSIASRGAAQSHAAESTTSSATLVGFGRSGPTSFPLTARNRAERAPDAKSWEAAKTRYLYRSGQRQSLIAGQWSQANWTPLHSCVAQLIVRNRGELHTRPIHVTLDGYLLALVDMSERGVYVRRKADDLEDPTRLEWRNMPMGAAKHAGIHHSQFVRIALYDMLWLYGLIVPEAAEELPEAFGHKPIQLRRLPLVSPLLLQLRHLALMHEFSAGATHFDHLFQRLQGEAQELLCADLASLYFTGAIKLLK